MSDPAGKPCILCCAITGSVPTKADNPAVPITVSEQIESSHAAVEAGAAIIHAHVRNDDGSPSSDPEKFARLQEGLKRHCPGVIIQFSTGGRSGAGAERGGMLPKCSNRISRMRLRCIHNQQVLKGRRAMDKIIDMMYALLIPPRIWARCANQGFQSGLYARKTAGCVHVPLGWQQIMCYLQRLKRSFIKFGIDPVAVQYPLAFKRPHQSIGSHAGFKVNAYIMDRQLRVGHKWHARIQQQCQIKPPQPRTHLFQHSFQVTFQFSFTNVEYRTRIVKLVFALGKRRVELAPFTKIEIGNPTINQIIR